MGLDDSTNDLKGQHLTIVTSSGVPFVIYRGEPRNRSNLLDDEIKGT